MGDEAAQLDDAPGAGGELGDELVAVFLEVHGLDELVHPLVDGELGVGDTGDAQKCGKRGLDLALPMQGDGEALGNGQTGPQPGVLEGTAQAGHGAPDCSPPGDIPGVEED